MTTGRKLMTGSIGMLALTLMLGTTSLYIIETLGAELSHTASVTARNLELTGSIASDANTMLSTERGLLLRLTLGDHTKAGELQRRFSFEAQNMAHSLDEIHSLTSHQEVKAAVDTMQRALASWTPAHNALWQLGSRHDYHGALKTFDERVLPQVVLVEKAAADVVAIQHRLLEEEKGRSSSLLVRSRWIATSFVTFYLVAGILMVWIVRKITGSLKQMAVNMASTAADVIQASHQISLLSEQLASGASEQAGSLEETSASSTEISSMTQQNAAYAQAATALVSKVDEQVQQANQNLAQMLSSMHEINDSSKKVAQIITIIEKIAFQTNLLALNAAVEAARAGEAGLGFAVVADEVRSLAQRCSEAARDTGVLITAAVTSCHDGSNKLNLVERAIAAITESTSKVREMVASVSAASQEQARGITQISDGLSRMERVTQQTAASAEEGSAASRQMESQAHTLQEIVQELRAMVDESASELPENQTALHAAYA